MLNARPSAMLDGLSLLGSSHAAPAGTPFRATDPATGRPLDGDFYTAAPGDVDRAATLAAEAFETFGRTSGTGRAALLRRIADGLEADAEPIVARANQETALAEARLRGELARTTGQLRLFAAAAEEGSWVDARIDHADPARQPAPKPDLRSMLRPLGPVAIFGASNFPLAFSVAGGDTASALAAGCPVVVKAHPAHPGTSALVGRVVQAAVAAEGLPEGVFSLLFDVGIEAGLALVRHPAIRAVGFTGSRTGGLALVAEAAGRPEPIPVYAEMGSVNPFVVLPEAASGRGPAVAAALCGSLTLGVGQFCTGPGLVFIPEGAAGDAFLDALAANVGATPAGPMLTAGIARAYRAGADRLAATPGVRACARAASGDGPALGAAALFETDTATFRAHPHLAEEVFGPVALAVRYRDAADLAAVAASLEGQLTATVHGTAADLEAHAGSLAALEGRVGRVVFNGVPTGVEVGHATVHGGPFPATSDGRSTSVGTRALSRWVRAVCWQDAPEAVLPPELHDANPLGLRRLVDGRWTGGR
ncbi:MAG TPA: aldehyde dehydrogenase (NADP(+)) [Rubricoccaceae bacterium]|nr:aldehyde dehydrogenase (NADP(+)) [Rubricoccaceae bacterium]